jgi:Tol biopolymer transport system component
VDAAGHSVNGPSVEPSISGDGRLVAFQSFATTLVPGDSNLVGDIFVFDRQTGTIQRVSVSSAGDQADGQSFEPSISGDGRYVAFGSDATNLVPGDTNGASDIFVFDCQTGTIERISVDGAGNEANGVSFAPSISGDGRYVAFGSLAANLVPGDTNGWVDIFVFDRQTQAIERVSVTAAGGQTNGISGAPSISNDGRYVAFESFATNLVPGDGNGTSDIFVFDRQAGTIQRVSVTDAGNEADGESRDPSISGDGRYVAFASDAANLVPGDGNGAGDVFVFDRQAGSIERVSVTGAGGQANAPSFEPSINDDGRFVAFQSQASNLVAWDSNNALDVFVRATMPFYSVTLIGEEVVDHLDFGNAQRVGRIEGLKYHDLDNDGVRDPGEPGLAGWIIYVDLNDNGVHEAAEPFTTTGADGVFALVGDISQGDFKVREEPQPGWAQTQPAQGYYDLQFLPGAVFTGLVFGNRTAIDYGDAPLPYPTLAAAGGASHLLQPGFHLGNVVDDEPDGQPAVGADGDDTHAVDDEDGVRFLTPLIPGQMARIEVTASAAGALDAWIDFNADGDWADVGERIFTAQPLVPGPNLLNFMVPSSARGGQTYSRFRFSSQGVPSYDGPGPAGEVEDYPLVVAGEIGPIDFWEAGGLVLDGQNLYFGFSTVHPGFLTLEVLRPEPPKSARIRLYDQDPRQNTGLTPLAGSQLLDGNQRIDWVTAAGQHYYVELYGLNPDFDLRVANLVWHDGTDVTVFGTTGDDRFEFDAAHSRTISINGVIYHFADEQVSSVGFDGGEGHDVVSMYDSPGDETLEAWSSETAIFTNGPADSVPDFTVTLHGYNELHVYAPSTGHDVAILHGTPGNDKFKSEPMENYAKIYGGAQYNRVKFFDEVDVYSSSGMELAPGADGGKDLARLWDSNGSDTFRGGLGLSHYQGPSFNVRVHDYSQVIAYSKFDGVDVATLVDSALKDEFQGKPHKSEIFDLVTGGEVYKVTGRGFDVVHGQALNQEGAAQNGGRDKAKLWGTPWDDFVEAADDWLRYRFSRDAGTMEQLYEILAFESVTVRKTEGGSDTKDVADPLLYELLFEEGWGP